MKLRIKVGELVEQISQAAITIDQKSVGQPNSRVYLRAAQKDDVGVVYFYSTNQQAKTFIKSEAEVLSPGEVLVDPARLLGGLQGRDPSLVAEIEDVEKESGKVILVKIGRNKFQLKFEVGAEKLAAEISKLPFKNEPMATIPAQLLNDFIRRSSFCIPSSSNGQQRFAMDVMHVKAKNSTYSAQATDGNIVSVHYGPKNEQLAFSIDSLLIPQEALNPLQRIVQKFKDSDVELVNAEGSENVRELYFRMKGNVIFGCRLRAGKFPSLDIVIEQNAPVFELSVNREELKAAIVRASNFMPDGPRRHVQLLLDTDEVLKIRAHNGHEGIKDEVPYELLNGKAANMQITVALDYLGNSIGAIDGDRATLGFSPEKLKAVVIRGEAREEDDKLLIGSKYAVSPVTPLKSMPGDDE